jgi:NDP-sugar pyrophosphorylase family protein
METVAILAGGLATRLRPITETIPKLLVPVRDRPFIEYQLDLLIEEGFTHLVLCVGHLGEQIEAYFQENPERARGMDIAYSYDGPERLGTAGALRKALPLLSDPFLTLYGDSWLQIDYQAFLQSYKKFPGQASALMSVIRARAGHERSNVWLNPATGFVGAYNKRNPLPEMEHVDYGVSLYRKEIFSRANLAQVEDLGDIQSELAASGELLAWETDIPYQEIGSHLGLSRFSAYVESHHEFFSNLSGRSVGHRR